MKNLLLILIVLFGFNGCSNGNIPEPTIIYKNRAIIQLKNYGPIPSVPSKAVIDKPISIRELIHQTDDVQDKYVAIKLAQLQHASKVALTTRNRLLEAIDGLKFHQYQVAEFNKTYTYNASR